MAFFQFHGTLNVTIHQAISLTDENRRTGGAPRLFRIMVESVEETIGLGKGPSRLYATISFNDCSVGRTRIVQNDPVNPTWNETLHIYCAHDASVIIVRIKENLRVGAALLGKAFIPVKDVISGAPIRGWYDLCHDDGRQVKGGSKVYISLAFIHATRELLWGTGVKNGFGFYGVPFTFFKQHRGCKVTLYQDAHMHDNFLPPIYLADNKLYQPTKCWKDMHGAISNAKHIIYILGWAVYTEIILVRDKDANGLTIGQLLKQKADEGVAVHVLIWDDRTSLAFHEVGIMNTHDEETLQYFKPTAVKCRLCPRNPDNALSMAKGFQIGTMFTHHQKTVTVDVAIPGSTTGKRRLVSFVGGLDLCQGRYDTQDHSLFHTLNSVHKDDFRQTGFQKSGLKLGGPREPWHDIHAKIEGPAAWDVLYNFEQRWRKQAGRDAEYLYPIQQLETLEPPKPIMDDYDWNTWNVQIFRSIDAGAVTGFPSKPEEASAKGLVSGKDYIIDRSIQDAYIHAIRRAKNFIYIENQYFIGSCFSWNSHQNSGALNIIPREITLKIVRKIEAGERFTAYIVIPMWPEGIPESVQVQAILELMIRTIEMMYKTIAQALQARQMFDASPKDYLSFFCLGNRERKMPGDYLAPEVPEPGSNYKSAQDNRRFMIYVHSKMMIVDDEYIIVGSANINERSMDGGRDTEIAMGAYQPYHIVANHPPRGEVHGFRMALWYEHLGILDDEFLQPWSLNCIRKVNMLAGQLWGLFVNEAITDLPGHLLTYPLAVAMDGSVNVLPGFPCFPDTKASILGARSAYLPDILTT